MEIYEIKILRERCKDCGNCLELCPQSKATETPPVFLEDDGVVRVGNPASCIGCFTCVEFCRASAVRVLPAEGFPLLPDIFVSRPTSRIF
ncbi:MAG: 4Fe-4S dicluster domain-containing protein [Actinomycetota bacterium]|nr:4Fe-4S dicluster domain-containing protein [Actinomycetota bacterium]